MKSRSCVIIWKLCCGRRCKENSSLIFICYKISILTKYCLSSVPKTKATGLPRDLKLNQQVLQPAQNPRHPTAPSGQSSPQRPQYSCASCSTDTSRPIPPLQADSPLPFSAANLTARPGAQTGVCRDQESFLAMLTKYILSVKNAWDRLKMVNHCMDSLRFFI